MTTLATEIKRAMDSTPAFTKYSKPLEVIWLCYSCHLAEHGKKTRSVKTKDQDQ